MTTIAAIVRKAERGAGVGIAGPSALAEDDGADEGCGGMDMADRHSGVVTSRVRDRASWTRVARKINVSHGERRLASTR